MTLARNSPIRSWLRSVNTSATRCSEPLCLVRCGCQRPRRSDSRSSRSTLARGVPSPIAMWPRRCTVSRRSGLGRGLSSLIPQAEQAMGMVEGDRPTLSEIAVEDISPNPNQPRVHFDEESLTELAESIAQIGVLQPVLVRSTPSGYQLIAGERRWRAAKRAGLATVPAIIRVSDDIRAVEEALVENLHRQDLTPLEEAAAFLQLIEDFQLTHDDVARRIGKSRSAVTNTLRLLGLPPE